MKAKTVCLLALPGVMACSCGKEPPEEPVEMGRYAETWMELPKTGEKYVGLVQEKDRIRHQGENGSDLFSADGGESFAEEAPPETYGKWINRMTGEWVSPGGARIFDGWELGESCDAAGHYLLTESGQETKLAGINGDSMGAVCYGGRYFYCESGDTYGIYRVNPETEDVRFLSEGYYPYSMAADEKLLYLQCYDRTLLYDLEKGEIAARQDEVLDHFVSERLLDGTIQQSNASLYPYRDGVYVLTRDGIYWHTVYGEDVELVVDGAISGLGSQDRELLGMAIVEKEEKPDFLVLYSDGNMARYSYDASLAAEPEISLRVYSLYEDGNVRRMVDAFRQAHPELHVRYETGMGFQYGATQEDALKNLATELASGRGPDIIVSDEIPLRSYVEKRVFLELSGIREQMREEAYFLKVIDGIKYDDKLYTIPLSFAIPVVGGSGEKLADAETLEDFADLLEKERLDGMEGSLFGVWNPDDTLRKLAQASQGAWTKEDGTLDREAYLAGKCSLEEALGDIDSRVKLYLEE